jgi:hypothetical protein
LYTGINDILIFSRTEAEHKAHVRLVLEMLKHEKFYVCKAKSTFAQKEIKYLGHIVDKQGIRPDPKKVEAVQTWPVPKNVHDVRSFLGLVNYFRKFIDHYFGDSSASNEPDAEGECLGLDWSLPRCF